jgi:hypothetical protein
MEPKMKFEMVALKIGWVLGALVSFVFWRADQVNALENKSAPLPGSTSSRSAAAPLPGAPVPASSSNALPAASASPAASDATGSLRFPSKGEPAAEIAPVPSTRINPEIDRPAMSSPNNLDVSTSSAMAAPDLDAPSPTASHTSRTSTSTASAAPSSSHATSTSTSTAATSASTSTSTSTSIDSPGSLSGGDSASGGHSPLLNCSVSEQAEQIQWTEWHKAFHEAVMENQTALLKQNKTIHYGFAVVEFSVTNNRHINARALPHDDPTFIRLADEAFESYHMKPGRKTVFLAPNSKFDALVVRCYEKLDNRKILEFPASSARKEVADTRWHLAGAGVGNYVRWRTDDYEQVNAGEDSQASGGENTSGTHVP